MEHRDRHHGSIVAFEGPKKLISTQLRLLPTSPQILILPNLQHYMSKYRPDSHTPFSPRSYIKEIHLAALARRKAALRFLDESTSDNKRLVFLSGGSAGAVSQCISAISEHQTAGDAILAEATYRNIASQGVKGLDQEEEYANRHALESLSSVRDQDEYLPGDSIEEDPITRAMRAADALYKETDSLQPLDCYIRTRPRSLSLPMLDLTSSLGQASPFFVFGSAPSEDGGSVSADDDEDKPLPGEGANANVNSRASRSSHGGPKLWITVPPRAGSSIVETMMTRSSTDRRSTVHLLPSPTPDSFASPSLTPDGVVYGEARLVQMAASKSQMPLRKTRSLDDLALNEVRRRRCSAQLGSIAKRVAPIGTPPEAKSRHLSIVDEPYSANNLLHLEQAKFVKAQTTTIRRSPTFPKGGLVATPTTPPLRETYVSHGTDAEEVGNGNGNSEEQEFEPVLPLHEDLVIHFTSFGRDYILDSVIQSFKDGSYPIRSTTPESFHTAASDSCPSTPGSGDVFDQESHEDGLSPVAEVPSSDEASDYDPYAARGDDVRLASKMAAQQQPPRASAVPAAAAPQEQQPPPTPAQSPSPHVEARFHSLSTAGRASAIATHVIATQNALRGVLEGYYSQQEGPGYLQGSSSLLPEMDKLWTPIFRESAEMQGATAPQITADLILAIGCQKGVNGEVVAAVTGQVEKLGSKSNGMSRSGRLDIRYLIATAMQSSNTRLLTSLAANTLIDSPYALACLLIPHLDTYLAINTATRFLLLSYPPEHLATVISLQKLIGADTFKVLGILNTSDISDPSSSTPSSTSSSRSPSIVSIERLIGASTPSLASPVSPYSNNNNNINIDFVSRRRPIRASRRRRMSFSRADYLLSSSTTQSETGHLLSTIRQLLVDTDPAFYSPTPSLTPTPTLRKSAYISKFTGGPVTMPPASPPLSPPYWGSTSTPRRSLASSVNSPYALPLPPIPPPPLPPPRDGSPSPSMSRSRSRSRGRGQQQHIAGMGAAPGVGSSLSLKRAASSVRDGGGDARSAYAVSVVGEDEFYDAEERRLMPMYMRQSELRKGNSRKALKWLGLA